MISAVGGQLGWVSARSFIGPEDVPGNEPRVEGTVRHPVNAYRLFQREDRDAWLRPVPAVHENAAQ
ncbi:MAG: hypothetical protein LC104_05750 [Bacteroidales bacterium]|nr:hypothetical protein [Bacteroidales bacterium]